MASQRYASDEGTYDSFAPYDPSGTGPAYYGPGPTEDEPRGEWNPSEDTLRPVRGRHRVSKQRGGTMARSRAVLGVGVIAAVGAGGMATANEDGAGVVPGMGSAADKVKAIPDHLPHMNELPGIGGLFADGADDKQVLAAAPLTGAGLSAADGEAGRTDAGEALRARILQQADAQVADAEAQTHTDATAVATASAAEEAAEAAEAERVAEKERERAAEEERQREAEEERLRKLRDSYALPLSDYRLTSGFGDSGTMWEADHTGTDFAAPTGTPVKNIHTGVVKEAAWAGSYGYRVVVELADGTELSYSHLSSMEAAVGTEVVTGDTIGRVGSTGNSSGPHLHLEVRPGGGSAIDPLGWLRGKGLSV